MLLVVVPVILMALAFAWRYRATNDRAAYSPDWDRSRVVEITVWGIPAIMVGLLATMVWDKTHALDPYKPLPGGEPLLVQAVALNWKWLFIYPDHGIATVNELAIPADRPVSFRVTSQVAMNSFIIPDLGGQIYAMAGMETQLNLQANEPGKMQGRNMQFSGTGFPQQTFDVLAMTEADFDGWIERVRASDQALDDRSFAEISQPSIAAPVTYFASAPQGFFAGLLAGSADMPHAADTTAEGAGN
ncbi:cytochrome ubiquinol oxidase subunit II [Ruegeria sediminis]|uniref:Ubiquinol oxidase subunit 2 n=2 Tax=Ruegeria sediminis TaxID=2583820 RepID=A0ABY2WZN3_9RHOB|nr:cytochrome ubiquinol oxidase subunit II [Ruegeria sediminis]